VQPAESPWAFNAEEVLAGLATSLSGLSEQEAAGRGKEHGANRIPHSGHRRAPAILLMQVMNPLILVLVFSGTVSLFLGDRVTFAILLMTVLLTVVLGFFQEYRAERALRELRSYLTDRVTVERAGTVRETDSESLVPGDIVHLGVGDMVPADIRLLQVNSCSVDESSLTGESVPEPKHIAPLEAERPLPQYLGNMAFMGTSVASGSATGVVVFTGMRTFFGRTAAHLQKTPHAGDFQRNIRRFSAFLLRVIIAMTLFVFLTNALLGKGIFPSFLFAIAIAVGITPEVLPVIMTLTLSAGALRMAREKVITKKLASVEDLGNIDVLCCDKTGTLTTGKIALRQAIGVRGEQDDTLVLRGLLCNAAWRGRGHHAFGNPTDAAIRESGLAKRFEPQLREHTILSHNDFDFQRRRMSVLVRGKRGIRLICKGAVESVLAVSSFLPGGRLITPAERRRLLEVAESHERDGYRTIAVAEKAIGAVKGSKDDECDLVMLGFLLFLDPAKRTAKRSLRMLRDLGVEIRILSGDSPTVTRKICRDVELPIVEDRILTGEELYGMSEADFLVVVKRYNVFARVTPEQKHQIVAALELADHVVGFLGDGINDAPALRAADVGISVDSGVGIAKESADIILTKKSLRALVHGITEGRRTFGNITKYVLNITSGNYGSMLTLALSSLALPFFPMLWSQILLLNLLSDIPLLALATDRVDQESLRRPRRWDLRFIGSFMVVFGLLSAFFDLTLVVPLYFLGVSPALFRTAWFVESALSEVVVTFAIRTQKPLFRSRPSSLLVVASVFAGVAIVGLPFTAFGQKFLEFAPLPPVFLAAIGVVVVGYVASAEFLKRRFFRWKPL